MIDATMTKRMEEATRLTRAGKLHEAMAVAAASGIGAAAVAARLMLQERRKRDPAEERL